MNEAQSQFVQLPQGMTIGDYARGAGKVLAVGGAAIPRAMEAQAAAGKRLNGAAHELLKRLEPILTAEPANAASGGGASGPVGAPCALSSQIDRGTEDMTTAANLLHSILRRLAL